MADTERRRKGLTIDGFEDVSGIGHVATCLASAVAGGVIDVVLFEQEIDDVDSSEGGGEVEGCCARARGMDAVGADGAVGEEKSDSLCCCVC
jgi:hypothetical protein